MTYSWHSADIESVAKKLNTDLSAGLSLKEAENRLEAAEKKESGEVKSLFVPFRRSTISCFTSYLVTPFVLLLAFVSLLTALFGLPVLGFSVLAVTVFGSLFGGFLTHRYCRILETTKDYASPMARVKRSGRMLHIDGRNLVRGDMIFLKPGDLLTCDARIISETDLEVEEIYFNGDRVSRRRVRKMADFSIDAGSSVSAPDACNMLYAGSAVMCGEAVAVVCDIGEDVYLSEFLRAGALDGKNIDPAGIKDLRLHTKTISFIFAGALLVLTLIGVLTMRGKEPFVCVFSLLLASVCLFTTELLDECSNAVFAKMTQVLTKRKRSDPNDTVSVRSPKAVEALANATDLIFVGASGFSEGLYDISSAYACSESLRQIDADSNNGKRLLGLMHIFVKAVTDANVGDSFCTDGYMDSVSAYLHSCGYDRRESMLAIRLVYYSDKDGYACAETEGGFYRTTMTFDNRILATCKYLFDGNEVREINSDDAKGIIAFVKNAEASGKRCMFVTSDQLGKIIFEGIVAFEIRFDPTITETVAELRSYSINTLVLIDEESDAVRSMLAAPILSALFNGEIAFKSQFDKMGIEICKDLGKYCAYVGFSSAEYCALVSTMRQNGSKIAAVSIEDKHNEILARADVAISFDNVAYSSDKHKESFYEGSPALGKRSSIRCSQQTRLLSKIIISRRNRNGGGAASVMKAVKCCRGSFILIARAITLFCALSLPLVAYAAMSAITGIMLIDPLQAVSAAAVFAFLSVTVFDNSMPKSELIRGKRDYSLLPLDELTRRLPGLIARTAIAVAISVAVKIADLFGVFGNDPVYTLPIYICLIISVLSEVFISNHIYAEKGQSKRFWLKVLPAYLMLIRVSALCTEAPFKGYFYPNGIGDAEYFLVLIYALLFTLTLIAVNIPTWVGNKRR